MKKTKTRRIMLTVASLVLVCAMSIVGTLAVMTKTTQKVTNTFVAAGDFVDSLTLNEHKAARQTNGNWNLTGDLLTQADSYTQNYTQLLPNNVLQKDPKVTINVSDGMQAYLFVKVEKGTNFNDRFTYSIADTWTPISAGSDVYYYSGTGSTGGVIAAGANGTTELTGISVLTGDQVAVASNAAFTDADTAANTYLTFKAYSVQASGYATPAAAWAAAAFAD